MPSVKKKPRKNRDSWEKNLKKKVKKPGGGHSRENSSLPKGIIVLFLVGQQSSFW
jgi:hypothetical protein